MKNSNSMRSTKRDGWRLVSFTQLGGKKLRCNKCWEKINRSQTESHESSHSGPKKSNKQVERINSEIREIVEFILEAKDRLWSRYLLHSTLNKNWMIDKFNDLLNNIWSLTKWEKSRINNKFLDEIKEELGNKINF